MAIIDEIQAAIGSLTAARGLASRASRDARSGAMAWFPIVGLAVGTVGGLAALATGGLAGMPSAALTVAVVDGITGLRARHGLAVTSGALLVPGPGVEALRRLRSRPHPLGLIVAAATIAAEVTALAALPPRARAVVVAIGVMLGAWAMVVECYGGSPIHARGHAADLVGRARFREFGIASVTGLGVAMWLPAVVGTVVALVAASTAVAMRIAVHARVGGFNGRAVAAAGQVVQTVVIVVLGALAWAMR